MEDSEDLIENITNENYQELLLADIDSEIQGLKLLKLNQDELLYAAAQAIVYLKISDAFTNKLVAQHANTSISLINNSSLPKKERESITAKIIETYRADIAKIRTDRNKEIARGGGNKKVEKDSDGKQKAKAFVKECWLEWEEEPEKYKSKAAFAKDMLDKQESLTSQKVIEDWCREWKKEKLELC